MFITRRTFLASASAALVLSLASTGVTSSAQATAAPTMSGTMSATVSATMASTGAPATMSATMVPTMAATLPPTPGEVFATGFNGPRGLVFGPDGALYVAEGGMGGKTATNAADCTQVPSPVGPYTNGPTARLSKVTPDGKVSTVIDGLPSAATFPNQGHSDYVGVSDAAFINSQLYILLDGAGCSHGAKGTVNGVQSISADGKATLFADLSAFWQANPVKTPSMPDFEYDGDPYSMITVDGTLYVVEANRGELDAITADGKISRIVDISATQGHIVPTAIAWYNGNFYVSTLTVYPLHAGVSHILKISPQGDLTVLPAALEAVLGVAFDAQGQLYALEMTTVDNSFGNVPGSGVVARVATDSDKVDVIITGLSFPTAMILGADGKLYISNFGFGAPPGGGQILKVAIPAK